MHDIIEHYGKVIIALAGVLAALLLTAAVVTTISTKTKFSFGKAAVGGAIGSLFNPLGTAVGIATGINGKHGKTKFICQKCGKVFERKV